MPPINNASSSLTLVILMMLLEFARKLCKQFLAMLVVIFGFTFHSFSVGNLNIYNINLQCNPSPLCYDFTNVTDYLNLPSVQQKLGVYSQGIQWETCNFIVNELFGIDFIQAYNNKLPLLLSSGIPVVIYNGDLDLICNWVGGQQWVEALSWPGKRLASPC
jgi:carboxypeptidase C (cathepsin A)